MNNTCGTCGGLVGQFTWFGEGAIICNCNKKNVNNKCEHTDKAYSSLGTSLTSYPPINISYWICKDCGFEGSESSQYDPDREYRETKQRFENNTPCGKPHNNGEECLTIKEGI